MVLQTLLAVASVALGQTTGSEAQHSPDRTEWLESMAEAQAVAAASGRPILCYFWLDGSAFCERMFRETLTTETGAAELAHFVCVSVPVDRESAGPLVERFGVTKLPTLVFTDAEGRAEDAIRGFIAVDAFAVETQRILRAEKTVTDWRRRAKATPEDLDVRLQLALQLEHVGQQVESQQLQSSIMAADPRGETVAGAQLRLYDVFAEVTGSASDAGDPRTYELGPLYAHMPGVTPRPVLYEGWKWIADVEQQRGDRLKERRALAHAFDHAEAGPQSVSIGVALLQRFFAMREELTETERQVASRVVVHTEKQAALLPDFDKHDQLHHVRALGLACNRKHREALAEIEKAFALAPDRVEHQRLRDELLAQRD